MVSHRMGFNPLIGPIKTYTFNIPPFTENVLGSALTLPTVEPGTGQYVYTMQQSDMLTDGIIVPKPIAVAYTPLFTFSGKTGSTASTISYRILWNGASQSTGTSASYGANTYWTFNFVDSAMFNAIKVGDTVEVRFWSNITDANYSYNALCMYPCRPMLTNAPLVKNVFYKGSSDPVYSKYAIGATSSTLASESFSVLTNNWQANPGTITNTNGAANNVNIITMTNGNLDFRINYMVPEIGALSVNGSTIGYNLGTVYWGDCGLRNTYSFRNDSTRTFYEKNHLPQTISFRELWI